MHNTKKVKVDFRSIFNKVNEAASEYIVDICEYLLPEGYVEGDEYVARNPNRNDNHAGSFKINLTTGQWADFASGDSGGDIISYVAFVEGLSQYEAAQAVAKMVGYQL